MFNKWNGGYSWHLLINKLNLCINCTDGKISCLDDMLIKIIYKLGLAVTKAHRI